MVHSDGCVFRRCGCVNPVTGRAFGSRCPRLARRGHGSWYFGLELPVGLDGRRRRLRRGGYRSRRAAAQALRRLRTPSTRTVGGMTVGQWLDCWLSSRRDPVASTVRGYAAHVRLYLKPYLGSILLSELTVGQVQAMFIAI